MSMARTNILSRLREREDGPLSYDRSEVDRVLTQSPRARTEPPTKEELIDLFTDTISAVHGQVIETTDDSWLDVLAAMASERKWKTLLLPSTGQALTKQVTEHWSPDAETTLLRYDQPVEALGDTLFNGADAAVTGTRGAIAETGSLIVWPDQTSPRLMSLVPPVHIALLKADQLYWTLTEAMRDQSWTEALPTNALLISGPSKTADIEQTLVYGAHGPRELIVLLCR